MDTLGSGWFSFRKQKTSFTDPTLWVLVRKSYYSKFKRAEDLWLTREMDLFGSPSLVPPPGFTEVAPSTFSYEGGSFKEGEGKLKAAGFVSKGVIQ